MPHDDNARLYARDLAEQIEFNVLNVLQNVYVKQFFIISYPVNSHSIEYTIGIPMRPRSLRRDGCINLGSFYWSEDFQAEIHRQLVNLMAAKRWVVTENPVSNHRPKLLHKLFTIVGLMRRESRVDVHMHTLHFEFRTDMQGSVVQLPYRK